MTASNRRWFRFSLWTLFVAVTVLCASLAWVIRGSSEREMLLNSLKSSGAYLPGVRRDRPPTPKPFPWSTPAAWLRPVRIITLDRNYITDEQVEEVRRLFPEAEVSVVLFSRGFF
jgi:hypothetical protein